MIQRNTILESLLQLIDRGVPEVVRVVTEQFGISRQATHKYLRQLIDAGLVQAEGATRQRIYALIPITQETMTLALRPDLKEDRVWRTQVRPLLDGVAPHVIKICEYGFTEMLNNAIDHAGGSMVTITLDRNAARVTLTIADDGIGIFKHIYQAFDLDDERHAILELSKGKLTTDPERHSGQGIFFTSRIFDRFTLAAGQLAFTHSAEAGDWLIDDHRQLVTGTVVTMTISVFTSRTLKQVFDQYVSDLEAYDFDKTQIPVFLAKYGDEELISRSQAKRVLTRIEKFNEVVFDFSDVELVGQAFADEIFRVFHAQNPNIRLTWINANEDIQRMISRAQRARTEG